jgi:hypothetical protein
VQVQVQARVSAQPTFVLDDSMMQEQAGQGRVDLS